MKFYELLKQTMVLSSTNAKRDLIVKFFQTADKDDHMKLKMMVDPHANYYFDKKMISKATDGMADKATKTAKMWPKYYAFLRALESRELSGNDALDTFTSLARESYPEELLELISILTNAVVGFSLSSVNAAHKELYGIDFIEQFQVQLADKWDEKKYKKYGVKEYYASRKLDGLRMYYDATILVPMSRKNKPHKGMDDVKAQLDILLVEIYKGDLAKLGIYLFDGELYTHGKTFSSIQGAISRGDDKEAKSQIKYNIFAVLGNGILDTNTMIFALRRIGEIVKKKKLDLLEVLSQDLIPNTPEAIKAKCIEFVEEGYEGIMLRHPVLHYDFKRSRALLKYKMFFDATVEVVDTYEGEGRLAGTLGGLTLRDKSGTVEADCGSGYSDEMRNFLWNGKHLLIGKLVEVKYQGVSIDSKGKKSLRFPIFRGIREDQDTADDLSKEEAK